MVDLISLYWGAGRSSGRDRAWVCTPCRDVFRPCSTSHFHGAHTPARRPKHAAGAETLEFRQALFAVVIFIDEFEFVLAKVEVL
jgi:hypothetical protein